MKRTRTSVLAIVLGSIAACGADDKANQPTAPVATEASASTTEPAPSPAPPEPAQRPAPTYLAGKWVWYELLAPDVEQAKAFYGELFGWTFAEKNLGGFKALVISNAGKDIGHLTALTAEIRKQKLGPSFVGVVSVPDVDAAVTAATGAGAKVHVAPMDVPDNGRFAGLIAPSSAQFAVMKSVKGDEPDEDPPTGSFVWLESWSKTGAKAAEAAAFYATVAGYRTETLKVGASNLVLAIGSGSPRMGFAVAPTSSLVDRFAPGVVVDDVETAVKRATKLGATLVGKPTDIPRVGRFAVLTDPQDIVFAIIDPI